MKKKIAIVIPSFRGGGAERVMVNIANYLDREKFSIKLIVVKREGPYINKLSADVDVVDLNSNRVRHATLRLVKELNEFKPDTILSTQGHLNLILLGVRKLLIGAPKIIIREANTPSRSIKKMSRLKQRFFRHLYKKLYPTADIILAQCKEMKEDISHFFGINENKITYIYNPVDVHSISEEANKYNPYDKDNINLVSVGRLTYQKGFDILIDAFEKVLKTFPKAKLTILGDGELKEELLEQIKQNDLYEYVEIIGFKDNPYPYYNYADLYVLSSRWEGFPNTLLEAIACKTKVIATKCKSGPREILDGNDYGYLVEVDSVESLSSGIISILHENMEIPQKASLRYDANNIIKEYEAIL